MERALRRWAWHIARVLGTIERHNAFPDDPVQYRGGWLYDRDALYEQAGLGPSDMDFLETYDDYPVISMMQIEDLGFCEKGEGPRLRAWSRPHRSPGISRTTPAAASSRLGQAGAAGGYLGLVEALRQLTGQALGTPGGRRAARAGERLRHDQLRPRSVHCRGHTGEGGA
ncbi:MAG: hypothetical protein U5L11_12565 [Arhodomonas sp.]|nr:hypothetical protein [Arhodomonas sp.]